MAERWYADWEWDCACDTRFAEEEEHGSCPECGRIAFTKTESEPPSWDPVHEIGDLGATRITHYCPWCGWEETL